MWHRFVDLAGKKVEREEACHLRQPPDHQARRRRVVNGRRTDLRRTAKASHEPVGGGAVSEALAADVEAVARGEPWPPRNPPGTPRASRPHCAIWQSRSASSICTIRNWNCVRRHMRPFAANSPATSLACCRTSTDQAQVRHRAGPCSGIRNARSSSHDIAVQRSSQTCPAPLPTEMTSKRAWLAHAAGRSYRNDTGADAAQRMSRVPNPGEKPLPCA